MLGTQERMRRVLQENQIQVDESQALELRRQKIVAKNVRILDRVTEKLGGANLDLDEYAAYFDSNRNNIADAIETMTVEAILLEKKDFPVTLGQFKTWEKLIEAGEVTVQEDILQYLNSGDYPLTVDKVTRQLQSLKISGDIAVGFAYHLFLYLREQSLEPVSLEDLLVFAATYKNLRRFSGFEELFFFALGFRFSAKGQNFCDCSFPTLSCNNWEIYLVK